MEEIHWKTSISIRILTRSLNLDKQSYHALIPLQLHFCLLKSFVVWLSVCREPSFLHTAPLISEHHVKTSQKLGGKHRQDTPEKLELNASNRGGTELIVSPGLGKVT